MRILILSVALMMGAIALPTTASAAECAGVTYPDTTIVDGKTLVLNGMGIRTATVFNVNVYMAGAYVTKRSNSSKELLDLSKPIKVVLTFMRNVSKNKVVGAYQENLDRAPDGVRENITKDYQNIMEKLQSVKSGDTHVFTYIPGTGLQIETIGKLRTTITNPTMIEYFLGLYIGPNPNYPKMRDGIVNGECL